MDEIFPREDHPLFKDVGRSFLATRYHSLAATGNFSLLNDRNTLEIIAETKDGIVMALACPDKPIYGVQFHPESICTEKGGVILDNFLEICLRFKAQKSKFLKDASSVDIPVELKPLCLEGSVPQLQQSVILCEYAGLAEFSLSSLAKKLDAKHENFCWLDSNSRGRYSILAPFEPVQFTKNSELLKYLSQNSDHKVSVVNGGKYACDFLGGFLTVFPYEFHHETLVHPLKISPIVERSAAKDFCRPIVGKIENWITFDHQEKILFVGRLEGTLVPYDLSHLISECFDEGIASQDTSVDFRFLGDFECRDTEATYCSKINACKKLIEEGESYELCLTTKFNTRFAGGNPLDYYLKKRTLHDSPFSAYIKVADPVTSSICCFSPEEFIKVSKSADSTIARMKPIKGTAPRDLVCPLRDAVLKRTLQACPKERAENLMITDLIRNDLGRIATLGSVQVTSLFDIETFQTCHQMVSTIEACLDNNVPFEQILEATFPPGSMTGAPKERAVSLLLELEDFQPRGFYSGSLGYLSFNGAAHLNVIIRTAIFNRLQNSVSIGAGGAITFLSNPTDEWDEVLLKVDKLL